MTNTKQKSTSKKKTKKKFKIFKTILLIILSIILVCGIASAGIIMAMIKTAPKLDVNQIVTLNEPSVLYDDKGNFMDYVVSSENRKIVSIKDIPNDLKYAFVAIEDERFFKHNGIDLKRIAGALYYDILSKINKRTTIQGASTITQQLIKNRLFLANSLVKRLSIKRKVQEVYLALQLEKVLSKDQILETYMNTIYLGGQCYGVGAAAEHYFSKAPKDLTTDECAFIAGLAQSPSGYYPFSKYNTKHPDKYLNRTKTVLSQMVANKFISNEEYNSSLKDLNSKGLSFNKSNKHNANYKYEYFSSPALQQIKKDLLAHYDYTDEQVTSLISNGGLKIYTTMDTKLQNKAQEILNSDSSFTNLRSSKTKAGILEPQSAAVIIDNHNGQVKTIIGGRGNQPAGSYNRAASDNFKKQTGSSIKALTVYAPAINTKKMTAASIIDDSPLPNEMLKKYSYSSQPKNDDFKYEGKMTLSRALTRSRNIAAIKIEDSIGISTGFNYASKFNLNLEPTDNVMSSVALGQQAHGTTPLRMAAAFTVFGNNGLYTEPQFYTKVVDKRGITILESKSNSKKVLSPEAAYIMFNLLKGPIYNPGGTGHNAKFGSMPVAGKTGTSTKGINLWFCGLTPYYSGAVWLGTDDNHRFPRKHGYVGSNSVAKAWSLIMKEANKGKPIKDVSKPYGIIEESICKLTGKVATSACKAAGTSINQFFINGTQPTALCTTHSDSTIPEDFNKPTTTDKSTNEKTADQSTDKNNDQSANEKTDKSTDKNNDQSIDKKTDQSIDKKDDKSTDQSTNKKDDNQPPSNDKVTNKNN